MIIGTTNLAVEVEFTLITSKDRLTKSFHLEVGKLIKTSSTSMLEGNAECITVSMETLGLTLVELKPNQAIALGSFDTQKHGNPARVVTDHTKKTQHADDDSVICRTKEYFNYPNGPGLVLFDRDGTASFQENRQQLEKILPELRGIALLQRASSGSCIYNQAGEELRGLTGQHTYVAVKDASQIQRMRDLVHIRAWQNGYGKIVISSAGTMLIRNTIADIAVFSPERLVYEAPPICNDGLHQSPPPPYYRPGEALDIASIPDPTPEEKEQVERLIAAANDSAKPKADKARAEYLRTQGKKTQERMKCDKATAKRVIESRLQGELLGSDTIQTHDGQEIAVSELLLYPAKYDGIHLKDPLEPSYDEGRTVAIFYANENTGQPVIFSHAHGGQTFRLFMDAASWERAFASNELDTSWWRSNWARLLRSSKLGSIDRDTVLKKLSRLFKVSKSTLESELSSNSTTSDSEEIAPAVLRSMTDLEISDRFIISAIGDDYYQDPRTGEIFQYQGGDKGYWRPAAIDDVVKETRKVLGDAAVSASKITYAKLKAIALNVINSVRLSPSQADEIDHTRQSNRPLIPFQNGVLDLGSGAILPHSRANHFLHVLPYDWLPGTDNLAFQSLLDGLFDDYNKRLFLAAFRATLLGRVALNKFFEIVGPSQIGKSKIVEVTKKVVGEHACSESRLETFETGRFEMARHVYSKMVVFSDEKSFHQDCSRLKAFTGGDGMSVEIKNVQGTGGGVKASGFIWFIRQTRTWSCEGYRA